MVGKDKKSTSFFGGIFRVLNFLSSAQNHGGIVQLGVLLLLFLATQTAFSAWPQEIPFQTESAGNFQLGTNVEFSGVIPLLPIVVCAQCRYSPNDVFQRTPTLEEVQGKYMMVGALTTGAIMGVSTHAAGGSQGMTQALAVGGGIAGAVGGYYAGLLQNDLMIGTSDLWLGSIVSSLENFGYFMESHHQSSTEAPKQYLYLVPRAYGLITGFTASQTFLIVDAYVFEGEKPEIVALVNQPGTVIQWKNQEKSKVVLRKTFVNDEALTPKRSSFLDIIQNPVVADSLWNVTVMATMKSPTLP